MNETIRTAFLLCFTIIFFIGVHNIDNAINFILIKDIVDCNLIYCVNPKQEYMIGITTCIFSYMGILFLAVTSKTQ